MTEQQKALKKAKNLYGNSAFTEHTTSYVRVGFKKENKTHMAIGDTWDKAFEALATKVTEENYGSKSA